VWRDLLAVCRLLVQLIGKFYLRDTQYLQIGVTLHSVPVVRVWSVEIYCALLSCCPKLQHLTQLAVLWLRQLHHCPLAGEAQLCSQASLYGICGGKCGTGTHFSLSTLLFYCHYHSMNAPYLFVTGIV
jgi:hypothetical protein